MRIFLSLTLIQIFSAAVFAQWEIRGSMGIDFGSSASLNDYINQNIAASYNRISDFNSSINFSGEIGYLFSEHWQAGFELGYQFNSFNFSYDYGRFEIFYAVVMPSVIGYYVLGGEGYKIKLGGGAGMRFSVLEELTPLSNISDKFSAAGLGFLLRADGNTVISNSVFANIGVDLRYDLNGEPKKGDFYLKNQIADERVNLNTVSIGVKLGVVLIL